MGPKSEPKGDSGREFGSDQPNLLRRIWRGGGNLFRRIWRGGGNLFRRGVTVAEVERFDASLGRVVADCERRCGVGASHKTSGDDHRPWCAAASTHLENARRERGDLRLESAWSALKAADREMIRSLTNPADRPLLCAAAWATRAEALAKVGSWRRETIELLLPERCLSNLCQSGCSPNPADQAPELSAGAATAATERLSVMVAEAKRILDDHADNVYHRLRILRRAAFLTTASLAAVTLGLLIVVRLDGVPASASPPNSPLRDWNLMLVVMLLGAAGAYVSSATRLARGDDDQRIPEIRLNYVLMAMRPVVGAASAVLVVVLLQSALGPTVELRSTGISGIAVAAGFTERLVTKVVNSAVESVSK